MKNVMYKIIMGCYIEAGVLERMLARAENLSARVDRLYERNRCKEPGE